MSGLEKYYWMDVPELDGCGNLFLKLEPSLPAGSALRYYAGSLLRIGPPLRTVTDVTSRQ